MNRLGMIACALLAAGLAGCASPQYETPTGDDTASLTFVNMTPRPIELRTFMSVSAKGCTDDRLLPQAAPNAPVSFRIRAGAEWAIATASRSSVEVNTRPANPGMLAEYRAGSCLMVSSFVPERNGEYRMEYRV